MSVSFLIGTVCNLLSLFGNCKMYSTCMQLKHAHYVHEVLQINCSDLL